MFSDTLKFILEMVVIPYFSNVNKYNKDNIQFYLICLNYTGCPKTGVKMS